MKSNRFSYLGYCGSEAGCGYCTEEPAFHIHAASFPDSMNKAKHCKNISYRNEGAKKHLIPMDLGKQCNNLNT